MEAEAEHFNTVNVSYSDPQLTFMKGVVVFETRPKSSNQSGAETSSEPLARVELGRFFVVQKDVVFCKKCSQGGHVPKDCPTVNACRECNKVGHVARDCPERPPKVCRVCSQPDHEQRDCPNVECRRCKQTGHTQKDCTVRVCHRCNQTGHVKRNCPQRDEPLECTLCGGTDHGREDCFHVFKTSKEAPVAVEEAGQPAVEEAGQPAVKEAGQPIAAASSSSTTVEPCDPSASSAADSSESGEPIDIPDPRGRLEVPEPGELDVQLQLQLITAHASSFTLKFVTTIPETDEPTRKSTKVSFMRWTADNVRKVNGKDCFVVQTVEKGDDNKFPAEHTSRLSPAAIENLEEASARPFLEAKLQHVHWQTDGTNNLALGMFADGKYGRFTEKMHTIRDALAGGDVIVDIHFYSLAGHWCLVKLQETIDSIADQKKKDPKDVWKVNGSLLIQRGQQISKAERPDFRLPARYQFDSVAEYFIAMYMSLTEQFEAVPESEYVPTKVRIVQITDGDNVETGYAIVEMTDHTRLRVDAQFDIRFLGSDTREDDAWSGIVVPATTYSSGLEHDTIIRCPRAQAIRGAVLPVFEVGEHVIKLATCEDVDDLREQLYQHRGITAEIKVREPTSDIVRQINTLRHMYLERDTYEDELKLLLNNSPMSLPVVNYFHAHIDKFGMKNVQEAITIANEICTLKGDQLEFVELLRSLSGGVGLLQGVGGTGKSRCIIWVTVFHWALRRLAGVDTTGQVWIVSPLNAQLDDLARRVVKIFAEACEKYPDLGRDTPSIVVRRHMRQTERRVWSAPALLRRQEAGLDREPAYGLEEERADTNANVSDGEESSTEELLQDMTLKLHLRELEKETRGKWSDRRLKEADLSEGQWMLHLAGFPLADGTLHPIAQPGRFSQFRDLLMRWAAGERFTSEDNTALTMAANDVIRELAQIVHVFFMTHHVVSEHRAHSLSRPDIVLHDEAGKTTETATLNAIVWARREQAVPHVLFGDTFQPKPTLGPNQGAIFGAQPSVSLFQRWTLGLISQAWFRTQYRFTRPIANVVNAVLPGPMLYTDDSVDNLPGQDLASQWFRNMGFGSTVGFMRKQGKTHVNPYTKSKYNLSNVVLDVACAQWALKTRIEGSDQRIAGEHLGIAVMYVAQLVAVIQAKTDTVQALRERAEAGEEGDEWCGDVANELEKVKVFTVDGFQGQHVRYLIFDTVVSDALGFVQDTSRMLLAITRGRVALLIIGDDQGCAQHAKENKAEMSFRRSAYYLCVHHLYTMRQRNEGTGYINLENPKIKRHMGRVKLLVPVEASLAGVHRHHPSDLEAPFDFREDDEFEGRIDPELFSDECDNGADVGGTGGGNNAWTGAGNDAWAGGDSSWGDKGLNGASSGGNGIGEGHKDSDWVKREALRVFKKVGTEVASQRDSAKSVDVDDSDDNDDDDGGCQTPVGCE